MNGFLQILATAVTWGLLPACIHVLWGLLEGKRRTKTRRTLEAQRLRGWRTHVPHVTTRWHRTAHMGTACTDPRVVHYIRYAREDALTHRTLMVAHQAAATHRRSTHVQN